uniref:hypothetical protein n=1 Tax=Edaphosphingomonas laterariae TaxID=861865 RepID=UPI00118192BC|nr:hypothetical protein [Sphingomonas laterariae]
MPPAHLLSRRSMMGGLLAAAASAPALAEKLPITPAVESDHGVTVNVRDLSTRFLDFYAAAQDKHPDERFRIWKDRYGFAAVPPTPQGDAIARKLLDEAWPRYVDALPIIRQGAKALRPAALEAARDIADLLQAPRPLRIDLVAYVGGFETNAFTAGTDDGPMVAMPIEMDEATRAILLPHEMTHAIHMIVGKLPPGYERSLGRLIFEEGLAMRAVQALKPGLPDARYVGDQPWFDAAIARRDAILRALRASIDARDGDTLFRFTMGDGATGREREAYIGAWLVVGELLERGSTLPALARLPADQQAGVVKASIDRLLKG